MTPDLPKVEIQRKPTLKQAARLGVLGSGAIVLAPGRRDWGPLLRRGWVEMVSEDDKDKRFLPPLRITADGLRALAAAFDTYPDDLRPEIKPKDRPAQLDEAPSVTRLKADLAKTRGELDEARRDAQRFRFAIARARAAVEGVA